jgi:hypothetical protein
MLKNICPSRFNTYGVRDWQLIKDCRNGFEQGRRE